MLETTLPLIWVTFTLDVPLNDQKLNYSIVCRLTKIEATDTGNKLSYWNFVKRCIYGVSIIRINKFSQHFDFIITKRWSEVSFLGFRLLIVVTYVYGNFKVKYLPRGAKKVFQILRVDYLMYKLTKKCKLNPEHKNLLKYLHRLEKVVIDRNRC